MAAVVKGVDRQTWRASAFTADPASRQEYERHNGVTARLRGALSLVNLLWAVAIGGVVVSVGPALYVLASPFQRLLAAVFLRAAAVITQVLKRPRPSDSSCCSACRAMQPACSSRLRRCTGACRPAYPLRWYTVCLAAFLGHIPGSH